MNDPAAFRWWAVHVTGEYKAEIVEVEDVMRCINTPGASGWVQADNGETWIARYRDLAKTRADAIRIWMERLGRVMAAAEAELLEWLVELNKEVPVDLDKPPP